MKKESELDKSAVYCIPNNFVDKGTIFGGMLKTRNAIEAAILIVVIGYPIIKIPMNLTLKIVLLIALCIPIGILALVGINKGPLSEFIVDFIKYKRLNHSYVYNDKIYNEKIEMTGEVDYNERKN